MFVFAVAFLVVILEEDLLSAPARPAFSQVDAPCYPAAFINYPANPPQETLGNAIPQTALLQNQGNTSIPV